MNHSNTPDGISIVIPYFNEQIELQRCLSALLDSWEFLDANRRRRIEITIIDDASDLPLRGVPTRPKIRIVRQPNNQGVGIARNLGAKLAIFRYIHFLDTDVIVAHTFLERLFDLLQTNPEATIVQGAYSKQPANKPASQTETSSPPQSDHSPCPPAPCFLQIQPSLLIRLRHWWMPIPTRLRQ